jgi:cell division transport system permease protein
MKNHSLTFWRIIRGGAVNFTRSLSLAAAAMAVMAVTLTIILFSIIASATFDNTISQISSKIDISVYLSSSTTTQQADSLVGKLRSLPNVKKVDYVSQEQALAEYKAENSNNKTLLTAISETNNPLPASIQIEPANINNIQNIKNFLDKPQYFALQDPQAGTSYSGDRKQAIDQIAHATNIIREAGFVAVIIFTVISVLIIFNTIRMAIFNRRDEIGIMSLLGASSSFIRGPYVIESMIYGIISALVSVSLIDILFAGSATALKASSLGLLDIGYANSFFKSHFWLLLTMELMIGILIGAVSSVIATKRYLKIKPTK